MPKKIIILLFLSLTFLAVHAVNVSTSPYGINVHVVPNNVLDKVAEAGIKWIRTGADWSGVEYARGLFDWSQVDRVVDYADANGLSILFVIAYTPGWANNGKGARYPADNTADWENFVRRVVNRYKDKVKYWNIWNEPNSQDFFAQGKDVFMDRVFLPAAKVIRATDPGAFIVGPELAHLTGLNAEWYFWMKYILTNGADYIDIVSHHIYKSEGVYYIYEMLEEGEALIPSVQQIIEESGHGSKPFWITETGWNTAEFSEGVQSERYIEFLAERKQKLYPHKIFFYEIIDDPTPGIDPWGILRSDRSEKPAYASYKDFIAGLIDGGGNNGGGDGSDPKKKCYATEVSNAGNQGRDQKQTLDNLRELRDTLNRIFPATRALTHFYYALGNEMLELSLKDSRIYRLGSELVENTGRLMIRDGLAFATQKTDTQLINQLESLGALLEGKDLSPSFRRLVLWGQEQLPKLKQDSIMHYLSHHLNREIGILFENKERKNENK